MADKWEPPVCERCGNAHPWGYWETTRVDRCNMDGKLVLIDEASRFIEVPKLPLVKADLTPPCTVELHSGSRHIVELKCALS